jgi:putative transposase
MTKPSPFKWFKTNPEIIRLAVMLYVRFPLSLRNVEDLLHERGVDVSHETVRFWWHRFGPMFASEIRKRRIERMKSSRWRWHLDEMFVKINGERHYLCWSVDHEGEVLESFVTKTRDKKAALKFLKKAMRKHRRPEVVVTDQLRSYGAALKEIGAGAWQEAGRWLNNRAEGDVTTPRHEPFCHDDGPPSGSLAKMGPDLVTLEDAGRIREDHDGIVCCCRPRVVRATGPEEFLHIPENAPFTRR